ncbi:MAG: ATP-binding protein [Pseudobdellovibrionaceae bacterium]
MRIFKKKPHRSLTRILIFWFLFFSIVPLIFLTVYSVYKYEQALNFELSKRLSDNMREVGSILESYKDELKIKKNRLINDPNLTYHLSTNEVNVLKNIGLSAIKSDTTSSLSFFSKEGRLLISFFKDNKTNVRLFTPTQENIYLSSKYINKLKQESEFGFVEFIDTKKISLVMITNVKNQFGKSIGFIEQILNLDQNFLAKIKSKLKLEVIVLGPNKEFIIGTQSDFKLYSKDFFKQYAKEEQKNFFDLNIRAAPFGFLVENIDWQQSKFYIALGASKKEAVSVLKNINYTFLSVVGGICVLLFLGVLIGTHLFLKPLKDLIEALQSFEFQEQAITIPVKSKTEIGLVTVAFNEMSKKIWQAKSDLRKKIHELESANKELQFTQAKLVHSAKMVSLGQLVAGVAHELNNPIGFIYSNMSHLKDYTERLIKLIDVAEKSPNDLVELKKSYEYDYILMDLPKLISSCQDGARRTRDIVLGLRNFSRLEEAKLQELDVHQSLDTTLNLLQGEIKNRIEIHRQYEPIPRIFCYASQVNQVFMNILSNAVQSIDNSGHVWISTSVKKSNSEQNSFVHISIQDSGKGMSSEILEKIFDPFFTTKGVGQGTGLGLSISYGIVQNHGGEIQVRSELGVGTEFIVGLPIKPPTNSNVLDKISR